MSLIHFFKKNETLESWYNLLLSNWSTCASDDTFWEDCFVVEVTFKKFGKGFTRNLRTDRVRECIFGASCGAKLEHLPALCHSWCCIRGFDVCTGMPKYLWICHWHVQFLYILFEKLIPQIGAWILNLSSVVTCTLMP